jgi:hypothetical protein
MIDNQTLPLIWTELTRIATALEKRNELVEMYMGKGQETANDTPTTYAIGDMMTPKTGVWFDGPTRDIHDLTCVDPKVKYGLTDRSYYIFELHDGNTLTLCTWDEGVCRWKMIG